MKSETKILILVLLASALTHAGDGAGADSPKTVPLRPKPFKPTILNTHGEAAAVAGHSQEQPKRTVPAGANVAKSKQGQIRQNLGNDCGSTLLSIKDGEHGYIQSPNYPNMSAAGTECSWTLKTTAGNAIYLTIFDIRTFNDELTGFADSIFISLIGEWNETQRFSGDLNAITPIHLVTEGTDLLIRFKASLFGGNQRGFRMGYHARQKPALLDPFDKIVAVTCNYIPVDTPSFLPASGNSKAAPQPCPFYQEEKEPSEVEVINRINPTPYLVALVLDETQFCAGTLIDPEHVITSAHCTLGAKKIEMIFGATDLTSKLDAGVQKRTESGIAVSTHPKYSPSAGLYDISIVRLSKPVHLTRFVKPARLPSWSVIQEPLVGLHAQVSSWGENDGRITGKSNTSFVQINSNEDCRASLHRRLTGMMLCLRSKDTTGCSVDAGSPITSRCSNFENPASRTTDEDLATTEEKRPCGVASNTLLGIMSFGSCERGHAFTRLTPHLDFISNVTGMPLHDFEQKHDEP